MYPNEPSRFEAQQTGQPPAPSGWVKTLFSVFFLAFVVGGLYFGYLFYTTVREVTAYYALPEPVTVPTQQVVQNQPGGVARPTAAPTATPPPPPTPEPRPNASGPVWSRKGRVNILLMGTDEGRQCVDGAPRTDTMIIVSIDPDTQRAYLVSIPRDLWVEIPGRGIPGIPTEQRINTAYTWGEVYKYPGGGPKLARDTVEKNFGQPIHYHAIVNLHQMQDIIDILGGVDIDVKSRLYDPEFPTDDCGYRIIDIKPGLQHMNGDIAMAYARSRNTAGSDFDRADRQQQVLLAMRRRALQPDIIPKIPALIGQYRSLVKTDMSLIEMLALASLAKDIDQANIQRYTIGVDMVYDVTRPDGARVLYPDRAKIRVLFNEIFGPK